MAHLILVLAVLAGLRLLLLAGQDSDAPSLPDPSRVATRSDELPGEAPEP